MKQKKIVFLFSVLLVSLFLVGATSALSYTTDPATGKQVATVSISSDGSSSLTDWFKHTFAIQQFSVVGDSRTCDLYSSGTKYLANAGDSFTMWASNYCASGHGLVDVYKNGWTPALEAPDSLTLNCVNGNCNMEVYCCSAPPTSQANCPSGSTFKTASCVPWINNGYKCTAGTITEQRIPYAFESYNYCSVSSSISCYYKDYNDVCYTRSYSSTNVCPSSYNGFPNVNSCSNSGPSCPSGQVPNSNGGCSPINNPGCTPDNSEAANVCSTSTFTNNCGDTVQGTKTCNNGGGESGSHPENIKITRIDGAKNSLTGSGFDVYLKNTGTTTETVNVEAGYYSKSYAEEKALIPTNSFSIFDFFAITPKVNCNPEEKFVVSRVATLGPGQSETMSFDLNPSTAFVTFLRNGQYVLKDEPIVSFAGTYIGCAGNTQNLSTGYLSFMRGTIDRAPGCGGWPWKTDIVCTTTNKVIGTCQNTFDKGEVVTIASDSNPPCPITSTVALQNGSADIGDAANLSLVEVKKISLTTDEIKSSTSIKLLASSCKLDNECLGKDNSSVLCKSVQSLRDDGTISQSKVDDFFVEGKKVVTGALAGGGVGAAIGIGVCYALIAGATAATAGAATPVAIPAGAACTAIIIGSAAAGAAIIGSGALNLKSDDVLVKALNSNDASGIGICTATPNSTPFDVGSFITNLGRSVNLTGDPTTDGWIVVIGGIFLLFVFLNMLRGGK